MEAVLSRLWTRQRRKRPLSPLGWVALIICVMESLGAALIAAGLARQPPWPFYPVAVFYMGVAFVVFMRWWPVFLREWRRRDGD